MAQLSATRVHPSHCPSHQFARGSTTTTLIKSHSYAHSQVSNSRIHNTAQATNLRTHVLQSSARRCDSRMQHGVKRSEERINRAPPIAALANDIPVGDGTGAGSAQENGALPRSLGPLSRLYNDWEWSTTQLVRLSTVAFVFLLLPQVLKNTANVMAGNTEALAILSWLGFSTAFAGNAMLLSYFLESGESEAALVQTIGSSSNLIMLTQIFFSGYMPLAAYASVLTLAVAAAAVNGAKVAGVLTSSAAGLKLWSAWREALGLGGLVLLPQALFITFTGSSSLVPAAVAAVLSASLLGAQRMGRLPPSLQLSSLLGWTATLLFMFQPLAQLINNFAVPASLNGLAVGSIMLAMVANGFMAPRALLSCDLVWFLGSAWGCTFGWLQLLSMFMGHTPAGLPYISGVLFYSATVVFFSYVIFVLSADARNKGVSFPLGPFPMLLKGPKED